MLTCFNLRIHIRVFNRLRQLLCNWIKMNMFMNRSLLKRIAIVKTLKITWCLLKIDQKGR